MPEYGGTLAELIASHLRLLKCPRKKEGVWEDTRMLKSARGGLCLKSRARGVQTMPEYGGTLPVVIASHTGPLPQKVGFGRIRGC